MLSTSVLRVAWTPACVGPFVKMSLYGEGSVTVKASTFDAFNALNARLVKYDYRTRQADTGAYNCRAITGGTKMSLHAYGIAIDINWLTNPYGPTLVTDMPRAMIKEIEAIKTNGGNTVFRWGGRYSGNKDAMHFEIVCTPDQLSTGISNSGTGTVPPDNDEDDEDEEMTIFCQDGYTGWWAVSGVWRNQVTEDTVNQQVWLAGTAGVSADKIKFTAGDFANLMINTTADATRLHQLYRFYADGTTGVINPSFHSAAEHALNDHHDIDLLAAGQKSIKAQDAANLTAILNAIESIEVPAGGGDGSGGSTNPDEYRQMVREEIERALNGTTLNTGSLFDQ